MRERTDTFQVGPVATKAEVKQLIQDKMPDVLSEARKTADGKSITARATLTEYDTMTMPDESVMAPAFIAHVYIEHNKDELSDTDLVLEKQVITETWKIGVYDSPELPDRFV